jgi:hypothetical protein
MKTDLIAQAVLAKARLESNRYSDIAKQQFSHPTHIAYYAALAYELMRETNHHLPRLPALERMGEETTFTYTAQEVADVIETQLDRYLNQREARP